MRVWLLVALVACKTSDHDDFPVNPGGGGPGGTNIRVDASLVDAFDPDAGTTITGRACLISDLRNLTTCAATGAGGLVVTLGTRTATTNADGTFAIQTPSGSNLVWRVSGSGVTSSVMQFGPSKSIPVIGDDVYLDIQNANSVVLAAGQGSIVARIVRTNQPVTGATAGATPAAQFPTKYDGPTPTAWTELTTSTAGTAWIAGADVGTASMSVTPPTGVGATEVVPVEDQAITYVTIDLP